MTIQFGLELDELYYPSTLEETEQIQFTCGLHLLVQHLEQQFGLTYQQNQDYLRVEQYRQVLDYYSQERENCFFYASFQADNLGTADRLLKMRDELLLGGWNFALKGDLPQRLLTLAEIEALLKSGQPTLLSKGFADRFNIVLELIDERSLDISKILLNEPLRLLPIPVQRIFTKMQDKGVTLVDYAAPNLEGDSDLVNFQRALLKEKYQEKVVRKDNSLLLIKAKRETYLATYMAKICLLNKDYRPLCLIPEKNRALDNAFIAEGLPSFGIQSASLARPTLQIIKLISTFLWNPVDPYKILEFVSLANKPLHDKLGREIASVMAKKPGMFSNQWMAKVYGCFDKLAERVNAAEDVQKKERLAKELKEARLQYDFLFNRPRYDIQKAVPKRDVIELFDYLSSWAFKEIDEVKRLVDKLDKKLKQSTDLARQAKLTKQIEEQEQRQNALLSLQRQAKRIVQVLDMLGPSDQFLDYLRLERLVRSINEPTAMRFRKAEQGHLNFVHYNSSIIRPAEDVLWWNFIDSERNAQFSRWYRKERQYLEALAVDLDYPEKENQLRLWQRIQPVLKAKKRLILLLPASVEGRPVQPHPLLGDLEAALGEKQLNELTIDLDEEQNMAYLKAQFNLSSKVALYKKCLTKPRAYVQIKDTKSIAGALEHRTSYSGLDDMLYYPYKWVFKHKIDLKKSSILSVVKEHTMKGNLAHKLFEDILNEVKDSDRHWTREEVEEWVEEHMPSLFEKEGAVMLMYGKEPEKIGFIKQLRESVWVLLSMIQQNNWKIEAIEQEVVGKIEEQEIKGIVDLILVRGDEKAIVDLKWGGYSRRETEIKNKEDLQLVIYAHLFSESERWPYTSYFIINRAKMIARNQGAFEQADAVLPDLNNDQVNREIWQRLLATYQWRKEQIASGQIEVRTEDTVEILEEEMHTSEFLDLLEMRREAARYDDFSVLIGKLS